MDAFDRVRAELKALAPQITCSYAGKSVAVLLPCQNEEATVTDVVDGFRRVLPQASIYVYDNNSTDRTAHAAGKAGAVVRREPFQSKGNVVRRMFADIDADIYVLADGGSSYDPALADKLIEHLAKENLDMVVGARRDGSSSDPHGGTFGSRLVETVVSKLLGARFTDIFSGYRVFSRRFAKSFPASSSGFDIETELSMHALDLKIAAAEVPLPRSTRPAAPANRLAALREGCRTLWTVGMMFRALRPFRFYGALGVVLAGLSLALCYPIIDTYLATGLVSQLPAAILAIGTMQLAFLSLACGLIVEAVSNGRRETKRLRYLDLPPAAVPATHWQEPRVVSSHII